MKSIDATKPLPTRLGFLLIHDFTLISMSSAIEPLRMANRICDEDIYVWRTFSESGSPVTASDGLSINVDMSVDDESALKDLDAIFVCGGLNVEKNTKPGVLRWLKSAAHSGVAFGSTCTGGTAPVDMMLHFIREQCGAEVSAGVAEQFIHDRIRQSTDRQRIPLRHVVGNQSEKLIVAVELMEANVRETISQAEIAAYTDLSRRQLQRLFQRYLMCTPTQYYLKIRLGKAKELLQQTKTNLVEVANLTGFVSSSHFSKRFKEQFGHSPSAERKQ